MAQGPIRRREFLFGAAASAAAVQATSARPQGHRPPSTPSLEKTATRASEVRALRNFAEQTHPRGREAAADKEWQERWDRLEQSAGSQSDGRYLMQMRHGLAWFEDGHTTVLPFEFLDKVPEGFASGAFALSLPWTVKLFDDGAYVVAASDPALLGRQVMKVGNLSTEALIKAFDATWPGSSAWAQNWVGSAFASPAQLQALGALTIPHEPVPVQVAGRVEPTLMRPVRGTAQLPSLPRRKSDRESWAAGTGRGNYVKPLPAHGALYLSIDDMEDVEGATFKQLTLDTFKLMNSPRAQRLIIDLRRNGGGNNFLGEPLRKHIERSRFNRPGGLYVLVGPATFSAAQNLANRLERETYALFVGGPTGLSPNHYGDAKLFTGKATGVLAMVSTVAWFDSYPQDKRQWIMPDLPVATSFGGWRDGRDHALDLAMSHRFPDADQDWSSDRIYYYDRASQKAEWKTFWI